MDKIKQYLKDHLPSLHSLKIPDIKDHDIQETLALRIDKADFTEIKLKGLDAKKVEGEPYGPQNFEHESSSIDPQDSGIPKSISSTNPDGEFTASNEGATASKDGTPGHGLEPTASKEGVIEESLVTAFKGVAGQSHEFTAPKEGETGYSLELTVSKVTRDGLELTTSKGITVEGNYDLAGLIGTENLAENDKFKWKVKSINIYVTLLTTARDLITFEPKVKVDIRFEELLCFDGFESWKIDRSRVDSVALSWLKNRLTGIVAKQTERKIAREMESALKKVIDARIRKGEK